MNFTFFQGASNGTARLMNVGAVAELTMLYELAQFREVAVQFFWLCVPQGQ
jgi:hypothetical protein